MPTVQVSLSAGEIASLDAEANEQLAAIVDKMRELGKEIDWSNIQRIVASTVAAQVIRNALPALEIKTAIARKKRKEREKGNK